MPQQLLVTILPLGYKLSAELYVPSQAIGQLQAGQSVQLTYDAFPKQKYGSHSGTISYVSDFVVLPGDLSGAFRIGEAAYKVLVTHRRCRRQLSTERSRFATGHVTGGRYDSGKAQYPELVAGAAGLFWALFLAREQRGLAPAMAAVPAPQAAYAGQTDNGDRMWPGVRGHDCGIPFGRRPI